MGDKITPSDIVLRQAIIMLLGKGIEKDIILIRLLSRFNEPVTKSRWKKKIIQIMDSIEG